MRSFVAYGAIILCSGLGAFAQHSHGAWWDFGPKYRMPVILTSLDKQHYPGGEPLGPVARLLAGSGREEEIWLGILGFGCFAVMASGKRSSAAPGAARPREDGIAGDAGGSARRKTDAKKPARFSLAKIPVKRMLAVSREWFRKTFRFESRAGAVVFWILICGYLLALRQTVIWLQLRAGGKEAAGEIQTWLAELAGSVAGITMLLNLVLVTVIIEYRRLHRIICELKPRPALPPVAAVVKSDQPRETAPVAAAPKPSRRPEQPAVSEPGPVTIPIATAHGPYWRPEGA